MDECNVEDITVNAKLLKLISKFKKNVMLALNIKNVKNQKIEICIPEYKRPCPFFEAMLFLSKSNNGKASNLHLNWIQFNTYPTSHYVPLTLAFNL